ncbi:cytochrome c-type biogenesis protein [Devosia aurantiaca]|uniref:Cytochrome c-type biogenesis protein n=1 Tax=Devosia aurantiaca TaxID=2714858 RepID=A0A6M1SPX5_9HYPH|nr:cytochrome c-type biogenesis protein [Devosia aurantiaca]NGP18714.1 cytochrome c-type biogenesis protein CcmH [Devosia aurantiaca]
MKLRVLMLCVLLSLPGAAMALSPNEILPDAALEQRARDISAGLRCLVCQNQSIDDSDADLARDLRVLVRERLVAGDSNAEVEQFLVDRYGEYVLLNPRLGLHTILLWAAAPVLLLTGLAALLLARRKNHSTGAAELTPEEASALAELDRDGPRA